MNNIINDLISEFEPIRIALNCQIKNYMIEKKISNIKSKYEQNRFFNSINLNIEENKKYLFKYKNLMDTYQEIYLFRKTLELKNYEYLTMAINLSLNTNNELEFQSFSYFDLKVFGDNVDIKSHISIKKRFDGVFYLYYTLDYKQQLFNFSFDDKYFYYQELENKNMRKLIEDSKFDSATSHLLKIIIEDLIFIWEPIKNKNNTVDNIIFRLKNKKIINEKKEIFKLLHDIELKNFSYFPLAIFEKQNKTLKNI